MSTPYDETESPVYEEQLQEFRSRYGAALEALEHGRGLLANTLKTCAAFITEPTRAELEHLDGSLRAEEAKLRWHPLYRAFAFGVAQEIEQYRGEMHTLSHSTSPVEQRKKREAEGQIRRLQVLREMLRTEGSTRLAMTLSDFQNVYGHIADQVGQVQRRCGPLWQQYEASRSEELTEQQQEDRDFWENHWQH